MKAVLVALLFAVGLLCLCAHAQQGEKIREIEARAESGDIIDQAAVGAADGSLEENRAEAAKWHRLDAAAKPTTGKPAAKSVGTVMVREGGALDIDSFDKLIGTAIAFMIVALFRGLWTKGFSYYSKRHPKHNASQAPAQSASHSEKANQPPPLQPSYWVSVTGETKGPYALDQIEHMWKIGALTSDVHYWNEAKNAWEPVADLLKSPPSNTALKKPVMPNPLPAKAKERTATASEPEKPGAGPQLPKEHIDVSFRLVAGSVLALVLFLWFLESHFSTSPSAKPATPSEILRIKALAEKGDPKAQCTLGACYEKGQGVEMNPAEAVKWYRMAAEQGNADAQDILGWRYYSGISVEKNYVEAAKWLRKAAEQGNAEAQYGLGVSYTLGQGMEKNPVEAVQWYRKAAEQGFADAQEALGWRYVNGKGVEKNPVEAVQWLRKATEQGNALAQGDLAYCYANGQGVEKNNVEALGWYNLASETNKEAAAARDALQKIMSPQQVADAQKRTKELLQEIEAKLNGGE